MDGLARIVRLLLLSGLRILVKLLFEQLNFVSQVNFDSLLLGQRCTDKEEIFNAGTSHAKKQDYLVGEAGLASSTSFNEVDEECASIVDAGVKREGKSIVLAQVLWRTLLQRLDYVFQTLVDEISHIFHLLQNSHHKSKTTLDSGPASTIVDIALEKLSHILLEGLCLDLA